MNKDARSTLVMALGLIALLLVSANLYQAVRQHLVPLVTRAEAPSPRESTTVILTRKHCRLSKRAERRVERIIVPDHERRHFRIRLHDHLDGTIPALEAFGTPGTVHVYTSMEPVLGLRARLVKRNLERVREDAEVEALLQELKAEVARMDVELRSDDAGTLTRVLKLHR